MNFPPINGVDEGTFLIVGLCLVSAWYGSESFWNTKRVLWGHEYRTVTIAAFCLQVVLPLAALVGLVNIYRKRDCE